MLGGAYWSRALITSIRAPYTGVIDMDGLHDIWKVDDLLLQFLLVVGHLQCYLSTTCSTVLYDLQVLQCY